MSTSSGSRARRDCSPSLATRRSCATSRTAPRARTSAVLGTPGYMAPEQARAARTVDARADVFALGCVLFECLTGAPAFTGEEPMAVLAKILFEDAPSSRAARRDVPPALDELLA